jgi:ribose transport system permease protein
MTIATETPRPFELKRFLAEQMRNIAPVFTLIVLVIFFSTQAPSFRTFDNMMNILSPGVDHRHHRGGPDLRHPHRRDRSFGCRDRQCDRHHGGVSSRIQPDYVNIANLPVHGAIAIILTLAACLALGLVTAFGVTMAIGIPSFIMTLAMMQIANGISAMLIRGQIAYTYPDVVTFARLRQRSLRRQGLDRRLSGSSCWSRIWC